jgi:hypothetical protein
MCYVLKFLSDKSKSLNNPLAVNKPIFFMFLFLPTILKFARNEPLSEAHILRKFQITELKTLILSKIFKLPNKSPTLDTYI